MAKDEGEPDKYQPLMRYRFSVADQADKFRIVRDSTPSPIVRSNTKPGRPPVVSKPDLGSTEVAAEWL